MNILKSGRKTFQCKCHHIKFCFLGHKQMWNLTDISLRIFNEEVKVTPLIWRDLTVTPKFPPRRTKQRTHENICKCITHVIFEPALLLYMLLLSTALKISQFQRTQMKSGLYNLSNCRQWHAKKLKTKTLDSVIKISCKIPTEGRWNSRSLTQPYSLSDCTLTVNY